MYPTAEVFSHFPGDIIALAPTEYDAIQTLESGDGGALTNTSMMLIDGY